MACVYTHTNTHAHIQTHTHTNTHKHKYVHTHAHTHTNTLKPLCTALMWRISLLSHFHSFCMMCLNVLYNIEDNSSVHPFIDMSQWPKLEYSCLYSWVLGLAKDPPTPSTPPSLPSGQGGIRESSSAGLHSEAVRATRGRAEQQRVSPLPQEDPLLHLQSRGRACSAQVSLEHTPPSTHTLPSTHTFTFSHLADAVIQSDLQ